ncbi:MAG: cation diffusion facilitator family transporter [Myxococcota bacterium]|nr:cation diffusion facilitator family transporter [Myxococcota bacterium]
MSHAHSPHTHSHGFGSNSAGHQSRLLWVLALAIFFALAELIGGWLTGSLALLADAFHLVSDVAALLISVFAAWITGRPSSARRTFGHSRAEILAALANGVGLAIVSCIIMYSALGRFSHPATIDGLGVVGFASAALVYEGISLWMLHRGAQDNLNVRGAFLHVLTDALGSLGAIASGLCIWLFDWSWADPLTSVGISLLILVSAWRLVREALDVLMEAAPAHLDVDEIRRAMNALPVVSGTHDLHIWTVGSGEVCLASHVVTETPATNADVLIAMRKLLSEEFSITHTTIQVETRNADEAHRTEADTVCEGACPE